MTFERHRNKLRAKKYNSIPAKELNQLVIEGRDLDRVVNSLQRMVVKIISKRFYFKHTQDDVLLEHVQIANAAIAEALAKYKEDKIDFALYVYHIVNQHLNHYYHHSANVVKSATFNGVRKYAEYFEIDAPVDEDESKFDLEGDSLEFQDKLDIDRIFLLIKQKKPLYKRKYVDIFIDTLQSTDIIVAEKYGISASRVGQIRKEFVEAARDNELLMKYLSQFI
jgi:DNA-directed RNA polymerase sigma subunit (sigma70/sigma32)